MTDKKFTITPYVEHIPDVYTAVEEAEGASWELGAGTYEVGFEVNGAKVPLRHFKGGQLDKLFAQAEAAKEKPDTSTKPA